MRTARKRYFRELVNGKPTCFRCGHRFKKNDRKFYMYPPLVGGEQVCEACKRKEGGAV
jgi:hypothetical protein